MQGPPMLFLQGLSVPVIQVSKRAKCTGLHSRLGEGASGKGQGLLETDTKAPSSLAYPALGRLSSPRRPRLSGLEIH